MAEREGREGRSLVELGRAKERELRMSSELKPTLPCISPPTST